MPEFRLNLKPETVAAIQRYAEETGVNAEAMVTHHLDAHHALLMDTVPDSWMAQDQWDALYNGTTCPLCRSIADAPEVDEHGYTIAEMQVSRLRLVTNQSIPGYCILILNQHVCEPFDLSADQRDAFFADMSRAAQAIETAIRREGKKPIKINYQVLGNTIPHMHAHIKPRFIDDYAPMRPIRPRLRQVLLSPEDYTTRVALIREALDSKPGTR